MVLVAELALNQLFCPSIVVLLSPLKKLKASIQLMLVVLYVAILLLLSSNILPGCMMTLKK
jgi:hypothetical protein